MFIKKTYGQSKASTSKPPMAGPTTNPAPTTVMIRPIALPLSLGGKTDMTMAMPMPWVMAAPTPWRSRERISIIRVEEDPASPAPGRQI